MSRSDIFQQLFFLRQRLARRYHSSENVSAISTSLVIQVIGILANIFDLCDTPLPTLLTYIANNHSFKGVDLQLVRSKIIKQKHILKRNRAKNRTLQYSQSNQVSHFSLDTHPNSIIITSLTTANNLPPKQIIIQEEEEFKKKRNRVSAQISRDRKKQQTFELETINKKLQNQLQSVKKQNCELKQKLQNQSKSNDIHSRFAKLMLFFGVIFVLRFFKDSSSSSLSFQNQSNLKTNMQTFEPILFDFQQRITKISPQFPFYTNLTSLLSERDQFLKNVSLKQQNSSTLLSVLSELLDPGPKIFQSIKQQFQKGIMDWHYNYKLPFSFFIQIEKIKQIIVS